MSHDVPCDDTLRSPLAGIRVVALEQAVAMPYCSFVLAELGASVVKIERPAGGDVIRQWDKVVRGLSSGFVWVNAGKRDIAVDVARAEGRDIVRRLCADADAFVENFAPGTAQRLGLGRDDLRAVNERLIYCSLSGYGGSGPYRDMKAYDLLMQGESGMLLSNGTPQAPAKIGLPVTDLIAGTNAALGILSALIQRDRTGRGVHLDVAMLDAVLPWLGYFPHRFWHQGEEPPRTGMRHQYLVPYGPYEAADGRLVNVVVASEANWAAFCAVVEHPEWVHDPVMGTFETRRDHRQRAEAAVEAVMRTRAADEWIERLAAARLPYGLVRTIAEVVTHPQVTARGMVVSVPSPVGEVPVIRFPLAEADRAREIPGHGQHTGEILEELGYTARDIKAMRASGVVRG